MAQIKIEIVIPDYEYKDWNDFQDGIEEVKSNLKSELSKRLRQDYIRNFEITITDEE